MTTKYFPNGEIQIQDFDLNTPIIQSTNGNTNLLKLLLIAQMSNNTEAVIPYFAYSRQDKPAPNSSSMQDIVDFIEDKIINNDIAKREIN